MTLLFAWNTISFHQVKEEEPMKNFVGIIGALVIIGVGFSAFLQKWKTEEEKEWKLRTQCLGLFNFVVGIIVLYFILTGKW